MLEGEVTTIGRSAENGIVLDHESVSSRHAEIRCTRDGYRLHDLGSANGTKLNGNPVQTAELNTGDIIRFAPVEARFVQEDREPANPLPESESGSEVKQEVKDLKSISSSLRHTAAKVMSGIVSAGRLAGLKAKIAKLKTVDLNAAHYALGKKCHQLGLEIEQLSVHRNAILELEQRIMRKHDGVSASTQETTGQKVKRFAANSKSAAEAEGLALKRTQLLVAFGEHIARLDKHLPELSVEYANLTAIHQAVSALDAEYHRLAATHLAGGRLMRCAQCIRDGAQRAVLAMISWIGGHPRLAGGIALVLVIASAMMLHEVKKRLLVADQFPLFLNPAGTSGFPTPFPFSQLQNLPKSEEGRKIVTHDFILYGMEPLVEPPNLGKQSPSYMETVNFISTTVRGEPYFRTELGVGKWSGKLILRRRLTERNDVRQVFVVSPSELSPSVKVFSNIEKDTYRNKETGSVRISCTNNKKNILFMEGQMLNAGFTNWFDLATDDLGQARQLAKAVGHLIEMLGGRTDSF